MQSLSMLFIFFTVVLYSFAFVVHSVLVTKYMKSVIEKEPPRHSK